MAKDNIEPGHPEKLWFSGRMREYIYRLAWGRGKTAEEIEDYIQEAWLRLCREPPDKDCEYYKHAAFKAIHAAYCRNRREQKAREKYAEKQRSEESRRRTAAVSEEIIGRMAIGEERKKQFVYEIVSVLADYVFPDEGYTSTYMDSS